MKILRAILIGLTLSFFLSIIADILLGTDVIPCFFQSWDNWIFVTKDKIWELIERAVKGYWSWIEYGGWHRVVAGIVTISFIFSLLYIWEKWKKFYNKWTE